MLGTEIWAYGLRNPHRFSWDAGGAGRLYLSDIARAAFAALRLIDGSDDQEKSLLEMIGGGAPAPRADLRFGTHDYGTIDLLTKRDGMIRGRSPLPTSVPSGSAWSALVLTIALIVTAKRYRVLQRVVARRYSWNPR